ncbi:MAG: LPS export ABC transporter periplasmic protein LptC, partial [Dehalococcoidia bacterium]|nr:LPS export ABC transporter periplasmic protein LptC [Dehalococcoidia bacterium]
RELTVAWCAVVERYIRQSPGHWVWLHRRWKTPVGTPSRADTSSPPRAERGAPGSPARLSSEPGRAVAGAQPPQAAFAFMVALLVGLTAVSGCGSKAGQGADRSPDREMDRFTLSSFRADDTRKWELQGQGAVVEGKIISVLKPDGVGYDQARSARMTAGAAQVNQDSRYIRLEYEATIHTSDGLWFTSPVLYWMPDQHRFETDNPVRIETDRMLLRGRGSHGSTALKHATILRDIELVMPPGEGQGAPGAGGPSKKHVTITCDGPLEFDYEHHIATFRNNVRVQDASGDLYSDVLVAYLNQAGRTIRYAEATGRVRIVQQHNTATSHKAVYQPSLGKITLVGRPSLLVYPSGGAEPSLGLLPAPVPPAGGAAATAAGTR